MIQQLDLSGPQLSLILELLQGEQTQLLVEIRHTDTSNFRVGLKARLTAVELLIQKVQVAQEVEAAQGV